MISLFDILTFRTAATSCFIVFQLNDGTVAFYEQPMERAG